MPERCDWIPSEISAVDPARALSDECWTSYKLCAVRALEERIIEDQAFDGLRRVANPGAQAERPGKFAGLLASS